MSFLFFPQHKNAHLNLHVDSSFVYYSPAQYTAKLAGTDSSEDKGRRVAVESATHKLRTQQHLYLPLVDSTGSVFVLADSMGKSL